MKLIDILVAQTGTNGVEFKNNRYLIFFSYALKPWGMEVWEHCGEWSIKGGELGEKWEMQKLDAEGLKKYNIWCGLED